MEETKSQEKRNIGKETGEERNTKKLLREMRNSTKKMEGERRGAENYYFFVSGSSWSVQEVKWRRGGRRKWR